MIPLESRKEIRSKFCCLLMKYAVIQFCQWNEWSPYSACACLSHLSEHMSGHAMVLSTLPCRSLMTFFLISLLVGSCLLRINYYHLQEETISIFKIIIVPSTTIIWFIFYFNNNAELFIECLTQFSCFQSLFWLRLLEMVFWVHSWGKQRSRVMMLSTHNSMINNSVIIVLSEFLNKRRAKFITARGFIENDGAPYQLRS